MIQNSAVNLSIGSVIANNGPTAIGLTKAGAGVLALSAVDTYTGTTRVLAGTIQVGIANALPTTGNLILGDAGTNTGGTLNLGGFSQTSFYAFERWQRSQPRYKQRRYQGLSR